MNALNRYLPMRGTTRQHVSSAWLVGSLALVLTLFAGCMPIQPTAANLPGQKQSTFEGLSSGLDNAKQARIRMVYSLYGAPNMDVYINGLPTFNGGKSLQDIGVGKITGWIYVTPGAYTVTFVPHGATLAQALFEPVTVNATAGHRFNVAMMGQMKEKNVKPLVMDETEINDSIGAKATDCVTIDINNMEGPDSISETIDDKLVATVKYGEVQAWICKVGNVYVKSAINLTDKSEIVLVQGPDDFEPAVDGIFHYYGNYPGENSNDGSPGTSELSTLDFLAQFDSQHVVHADHLLTFNTLLRAIDKAGLQDLFDTHKPYYFLAPTDEAFAALPKAQLDALLNDPQALTKQLKAHFIDAYYPFGSLSGPIYGEFGNVSVTNLLGQKLALSEPNGDMLINGLSVIAMFYTVGNGNRVQLIDKLLPVK